MGSVTVYGPPVSTAVSRVLACLLEKDVDFKLVNVDMAKGQHKSPDYLKLQVLSLPSSPSPPSNSYYFSSYSSCSDESYPDSRSAKSRHSRTSTPLCLVESRAICRYICDKYANRGNQSLFGRTGGGPAERAQVEQWLEAESQSFNPPSSALVFQLAFAPRMGLPQDPAAIELNQAKLAKVLDVYERRLGESRFLAGDEFALADLAHLPNAHYICAAGKDDMFASRKNVARWWEEISTRPSWKKVVDMFSAPPA
ncbi:hypothetical protein C4D60_Mb05t16060 [Musa balbisiana]|uniref:glutathione transferase n=1 Tax=Musa balbisiana TaxID=52838 RepID=A0A4S8JWH5_MUSBA|nr:hypothetical protein C4D60_Mb05t16060 [Musa balbisiana]